MKSVSKLAFLLMLLPASLFAQPGVRMSADFLPLEVGNRWVYDVFSESGQKIGSLEFGIQDYRITGGRSFYVMTGFPFVTEGDMIKMVRYDRQERTYMRMLDNEEGPLFLADGTRVDVLQTDESNLPAKFILHGDLVDLTFQRGMGIIEARMHGGKNVEIAKLTAFRTTDKQAAQAKAEGAPVVTPPVTPPPQSQRSPAKPRTEVENVAKATEENVAVDVQASDVSGGTKFVLTVINTTDKLIPFSFTTGQTYDLAVMDADGREIWRWSRRMFFTQVVRQEALRPNRNWTYDVTWNHRDNDLNIAGPGKYTVIGSISTHPPMDSPPVTFEVR
jgi:Intracellular proteinase inhibitor